MANDPRHREIIHLDLDAFYASVETLDNPEVAGKPVIVGGGGKRGVVTAASYEARKFGVHSAQPVATARRLCPDGVFLPVRMGRYKEMSDRVFEIFRRFSPLVEALSIDEAFLDVTGTDRLFGGTLEIARKIKAAVASETGLTVSAGGGGRTCVPAETLRNKFGEHGLHLHRLANGIDDREVEPEHEVKSIGHEDTYDEDIRDREAIEKELLSLAHRVSSRLRRMGFRGRNGTLKVKYHNFTQVTRAATLPSPTDDGATIYRTVLPLLKKTAAGGRPVRLRGISVSHFGEKRSPREEWGQIPLFGRRPEPGPPSSRESPARDPERTAKLNEAVDRIREKYGKRGIRPGTLAGDDCPERRTVPATRARFPA